MDARIARLLDREEIRDVISRYCRGIDRLDLETVRACYHPDATDQHGSFSGGVDAYLKWVEKLLARYDFTMHSISQIQIELNAPGDQAATESYGVSMHRGPADVPHLNLATGFRFLDRFEKRQDQWRIAERIALSEWSIRIPEEAWWPTPDSLPKGRRDSEDLLYRLLAEIRGNDSEP